jgi:hypothetical protein
MAFVLHLYGVLTFLYIFNSISLSSYRASFLVQRGKNMSPRYQRWWLGLLFASQLPDRDFNETAAGYISAVQASGSGGPRIMQFALRYEF